MQGMSLSPYFISLTALTSLLACTGNSAVPEPDAQGPDVDAQGESWRELISGDWSLAPGAERYLCVRTTVTEDLYLGAFDAMSPVGTHHTVLTVGAPSGPDGIVPCDSFANHDVMMYGSGVGNGAFELPDGVAVRVRAGQQLLLNLHLFNTSDAEVTGTSGTLARVLDESEVEHVAEAVLMGPIGFEIPTGEQEITGGCTLRDDSTLFAIAPHMHQLGRHMTVHARRDDGDVMIHDGPYDFDEQEIVNVEPIEVSAGDYVEVKCRYDNHREGPVSFGESSTEEMCFAGLYRYPARDDSYFVCVD